MARVAVVTGGTRGIGRAISVALKEGLTWEQAEELAVHLNRTVASMSVTAGD